MSTRTKVEEDDILNAIAMLNKQVREEMYLRGHPDFNPGHRRYRIQKEVYRLTGKTYSDSGFRNYLKRMVDDGTLQKVRFGDRITFYKIKKDPKRLASGPLN